MRNRPLLSALVLGTFLGSTAACSSDPSEGGTAGAASAGELGNAGAPGSESSGGHAGSGNPSTAGQPAGSSGTTNTSGASAGAGMAGAAGAGMTSAGSGGRGGSASSEGGAGGRPPSNRAGAGNTPDPNTPAPSSQWVNVTGNLAGKASDCGNLGVVAAKPGSGTVIAGVAAAGLFASQNGGETWEPLGTGSGSDAITHRPVTIVFDPENPDTFWEAGIYSEAGVFRTTDGGVTFEQLGDIGHNDQVSVDFSDPARKTLLAGGHEEAQALYVSTDGGQSFRSIGANLPSDTNFSSLPYVIDAQTFLVGVCGWAEGRCGIYRSGDGGQAWEAVSELAPFAGAPLAASDGALYWAVEGGLARGSADGKSWTRIPGEMRTPVQLPDGRFLTVNGDRMAVSSDGEKWDPVGEPLPYDPLGFTYSVARKTVFIWHNDCEDFVPNDAIMSAGFDYAAAD